jgi:hypothetical protein
VVEDTERVFYAFNKELRMENLLAFEKVKYLDGKE